MHLNDTFFDSAQGIGYRETTVVVNMDAKLDTRDLFTHFPNRIPDLVGHYPAIGITQDKSFCAAIDSRLNTRQRITCVTLKTIKKMLSIEEYRLAG